MWYKENAKQGKEDELEERIYAQIQIDMYIRKLDASARSRRIASFWKSFASDATTAWNPCTSESGKFRSNQHILNA